MFANGEYKNPFARHFPAKTQENCSELKTLWLLQNRLLFLYIVSQSFILAFVLYLDFTIIKLYLFTKLVLQVLA